MNNILSCKSCDLFTFGIRSIGRRGAVSCFLIYLGWILRLKPPPHAAARLYRVVYDKQGTRYNRAPAWVRT